MFDLPRRAGAKPKTTSTNPHQQQSQNPTSDVYELLLRKAFDFPHVERRPSAISVPGAQALWLAEAVASARPEAFLIGREFAHVHPRYDGSMHMMLPPEAVDEVLAKGWGEPHPMARRGLIPPSAVMVYAPRDAAEIEVILHMIGISYRFACAKGRPREGKLAVSTQWLNVPHKNLRHDLRHGPEGTKLEGGIRRKS